MLGRSLLALAGISALIAASAAADVGTGVSIVAGSGGDRTVNHVQVAARSTPAGVGGHFSVTGGVFFNDLEVRCIRTFADRTIVGGVIVDSWNPIVIGRTGLVAVRDGGPGGIDYMNVAFSISGLDTCPDGASAIDLNPVDHGNFVVR